MATDIWVNTGSGNGLLPDGTKSLPEPMLTDHQWRPVTFILGQFHYMSIISLKFPRSQWVESAYVVTVLTIFVIQEMLLTRALDDPTSLPEVADSHHLSSEIDVAHTSHSHLPLPQWWRCHCYHCRCWRCYHCGWYYHWRCCPWCRRLRQLVGLTDD